MSSPLLYDFALDLRCYAVRLGASLIGREIDIADVDVMPGNEQLSANMLAINPKGSVPILTDGDVTLTEPASMLMHLADGTPWASNTAHALDWLMFASTALATFNTARNAALFATPGMAAFACVVPGRQAAQVHLRQLENALSLATLREEGFLAGVEPSLADILAFPVFAQSRDLRIEPEAYPALRLWARRIRALPGFIGMPGVPDYH